MKLPRLYTVLLSDGAYWRGVRTAGDQGDWNLGRIDVVRESQARASYLHRLKRDRSRARKVRRQNR